MINNIPQRPDPTMPCTGCGECCRERICKAGMDAFPGTQPPCLGLIWKNGRYWCSLVKKEASLPVEKELSKALGIGRGCYKNRNPRLYSGNEIDLLEIIEFINREK